MSDSGTVSETPTREQVAEEIRALLARRKLSASELARKMGVSQPYLSRRLTGDVAIDVDDLQTIARLLGVGMSDLLPREEPGRVVVVSGSSPRQTTVSYPPVTVQPRSSGHPKRTAPPSSSRRPARLLHA